MRFRFEKATQTDFNFDRTEFQTVLKAAELEFTAKFGNWQCYMPARQTTANLSFRICTGYPLGYLKYINNYVITAYMSAYVKFATKYVIAAYDSEIFYIMYAHKR